MLIGATIQLIITGIQLGGEAITSTSGMQLGDAVDPTSASSMPSIARMVGLLVTAVMLMLGGHRILLSVLLDSFSALPAGQVHFQDSMMELVVEQLSAGTAAGRALRRSGGRRLVAEQLDHGIDQSDATPNQRAGDRFEYQRAGDVGGVGVDHRFGWVAVP